MRAPLGNSIKTFGVLLLLVAVGVSIWWIRRPADMLTSVGAREWTITHVDGEPAMNDVGTVSTFVLDGTGEIRAPIGCNVASGRWSYDERADELTIDWDTQTDIDCVDGWPRTHLPDGGEVDVDGSVMRVSTDAGTIRAVSLADRPPAPVDDFAGTWSTGGRQVDIGLRGLFEIGDCDGSWVALDDDAGTADASIAAGAIAIRFDGVQRDDCDLPSMWLDETPVVPVVDDGVLYLRRDRTIFPLDREIVRLDPVP